MPSEAIFLSLYLYGERRLSRRALFLTTIPITLALAASALFVISANGWMNTPAGFRLVDGRPTEARPWEAFANPAWLHEAVHGTWQLTSPPVSPSPGSMPLPYYAATGPITAGEP